MVNPGNPSTCAVLRKLFLTNSVLPLTCAVILIARSAQAQTFNVIHSFTGFADGGYSRAGLTLVGSSTLYGTTSEAQPPGCEPYLCNGNVFTIKHRGSGWILTPLYTFNGPFDAEGPNSGVAIGPTGAVYGTSQSGGEGCDPNYCGIVYQVQPRPTVCASVLCYWTETVIHTFHGLDSSTPWGAPVFDGNGNIYGTTNGYLYPFGTVFQLSPGSNGWTETTLYRFQGGSDGAGPESSVTFDTSGNLYGTTYSGGNGPCQFGGCGTVYELVRSGSGWNETVLYTFQGGDDGLGPVGGVVFDSNGNLYGTTSYGGANGGGTVFKLSPANGSWTLTTIYSFSGQQGSWANLAIDAGGTLYGTTLADGAYNYGSVFKLTRGANGWTYATVHDFTGGSDGGNPYGGVTLDASGNLYGTASTGGLHNSFCPSQGCGVVWQITP